MLRKLGENLLSSGKIDRAALDRALREGAAGERLGRRLLRRGTVTEEEVYRALAEQFSLDFVPSVPEAVDQGLLREVSLDLFREGRCYPIYAREGVLGIVLSDPVDLDTPAEVELHSGMAVEVAVATPSSMAEAQRLLFDKESTLRHNADRISREYARQRSADDGAMSVEEIRKRTESEPVVKMVSLVFDQAIASRASDIHVEPREHAALVRFRIDGMLQEHMELNRWMYVPFTSRIKILADLDIAEKRVPQDGRIRYEYGGMQYDFRVSTLPTHHGEKTVVRLLKHDRSLLELENLGLDKPNMEFLSSVIDKPQGMVFVTGPTGSGKSSTLFACLNRIRDKAINITTIENPIEYKLDGISQVQINEKAGVSFATTLRSVLRQDPDVILIGEIRDRETAEIAMQAAQTGHLVFSTLHTNDAVSAITRLRDLGVPSFLIASSLLSVMAQRLVRVLCPRCRTTGEVSEELRARWTGVLTDHEMPRPWRAVGCDYCGMTGYRGRTAIFELIPVGESLRSMISDDASESRLRKELASKGYRTMIRNGVEKVRDGVTTPEELLRVVMVDGAVG